MSNASSNILSNFLSDLHLKSVVVSDGSWSAGYLPLFDEILRSTEGQAELLSKHLESIHSQSGSRGRGGGA